MTSTTNAGELPLFVPASGAMDLPVTEPVATIPRQIPAPMSRRARIDAYWMLAVVCLFTVVAQVDIGAMPLLVNQIRADLQLSDMQMSMIMGFATTIVTSAFLLPAGYLADRFSRRWLLGISAVLWSITASTAGIVVGFWSLFAARAGLAAADATLQPAAHSLMRDAFPPHRRGSAFSIYWAAYALGGGISMFVSGALLAWANVGVFDNVPVLGGWSNWQIVLALPGLCTLPLALLWMTVREPKRGQYDADEQEGHASYAEFFGYIRKNWSLFWPSILYNIFWALQAYGVIAWQPTALERGWGISPEQIGQVMGVIGFATCLAGLLGGGWLIDQLGKRGIGDAAIRVCLVASGLGAIFQIAVYHANSPWLIFTCIGLHRLFQSTINSAYYVAIAFITPSRLMGRMIALQFLCLAVPAAISPILMAGVASIGFADRGDLSIIPSIYVPLVICSVIFMGLLALLAYRMGEFRRRNPNGA
jgi:MFS family permease